MAKFIQESCRGDINVKLTSLIQWIPDEILTAVIEKLGSQGTIDSEDVNSKFLLIQFLHHDPSQLRYVTDADKEEILDKVSQGTFFDD